MTISLTLSKGPYRTNVRNVTLYPKVYKNYETSHLWAILRATRESGECRKLPSGVWGPAPVEIEFDAFSLNIQNLVAPIFYFPWLLKKNFFPWLSLTTQIPTLSSFPWPVGTLHTSVLWNGISFHPVAVAKCTSVTDGQTMHATVA